MKFRITMEDPDGPYESIQDAAKEQVKAIKGITESEREGMLASRAETLDEFVGKWMEYGEYLVVEFDTEAGTATVIPRK